jgi:hypothetical protein
LPFEMRLESSDSPRDCFEPMPDFDFVSFRSTFELLHVGHLITSFIR